MSNARFGLRTRSGQISDLIQGLRIVPPLLDDYPNAAAAYSLRKLRTAYTGSAIRVRRASDSTEQDIGFDGSGHLDTSSLATFCSGTDGFVNTWYDQSGNANDATQTTAANQPKIYDSVTGVVTENGKPAVQFDGSNDALHAAYSTSSSEDFPLTTFQVIETATTSGNQTFTSLSNTTVVDPVRTAISLAGAYGFYNRDNSATVATSSSAQSAIQAIMTVTDTGTIGNVYYNGSQIVTNGSTDVGTTTIDVLSLGAFRQFTPLNYLNGHLQEVVFYNSDQSASRTGIETNINDYYAIY